MKPIPLESLPAHVQDRIRAMDESAKKSIVLKEIMDNEPSKADKIAEKNLQKQCEGWLANRGYARLTEGDIKNGPPQRGYQFHLNRPQENPLLLDILLLAPGGRYLHVELKIPPIRWQPGQEELIAQGYGKLCTSFNEFEETVKKWEESA